MQQAPLPGFLIHNCGPSPELWIICVQVECLSKEVVLDSGTVSSSVIGGSRSSVGWPQITSLLKKTACGTFNFLIIRPYLVNHLQQDRTWTHFQPSFNWTFRSGFNIRRVSQQRCSLFLSVWGVVTLQLWCLHPPTGGAHVVVFFHSEHLWQISELSPASTGTPTLFVFPARASPSAWSGTRFELVPDWYQHLVEQEHRCQELSTVRWATWTSSLDVCPEGEALDVCVQQRNKVKYFCPFRNESDWYLSGWKDALAMYRLLRSGIPQVFPCCKYSRTFCSQICWHIEYLCLFLWTTAIKICCTN